MITESDFLTKQVVLVFANKGEKIVFNNDNLVIKDVDGKTKFQCSCYRLFAVYLVGNCSLTTVVIQRAMKFGFFIILLTSGFRLYSVIGAGKEGNFVLHRKQYEYNDLGLAKYIIQNKINSQYQTILDTRSKSVSAIDAKRLLPIYSTKLNDIDDLNSILAYEGLASKAYFAACFDNIEWRGRQPRIKRDVTNSVLDIGYTMLFAYIDALLECFGFDVYCGVLHRQFYMRKSLVCDIIEPFRPIIDRAVRRGYGLGQIDHEDFIGY